MKTQPGKATSSGESLSVNQKLAHLKKWQIGWLNMDVPGLFKTTFQELLVISLIAIIAVILEYAIQIHKKAEGCLCGILVPLGFLLALISIKQFETGLLRSTFSSLGLRYTGSSAGYRVLQSLIILATVLGVNMTPSLLETSFENKVVQMGMRATPGTWSKLSALLLGFWLNLSSKLIGSFVMVAFFRLYLNLAIYSYRLMTYSPKNKYYNEETQKWSVAKRTSDENQNEDVIQAEEDYSGPSSVLRNNANGNRYQ